MVNKGIGVMGRIGATVCDGEVRDIASASATAASISNDWVASTVSVGFTFLGAWCAASTGFASFSSACCLASTSFDGSLEPPSSSLGASGALSSLDDCPCSGLPSRVFFLSLGLSLPSLASVDIWVELINYQEFLCVYLISL